jgi:hypothetical protein
VSGLQITAWLLFVALAFAAGLAAGWYASKDSGK